MAKRKVRVKHKTSHGLLDAAILSKPLLRCWVDRWEIIEAYTDLNFGCNDILLLKYWNSIDEILYCKLDALFHFRVIFKIIHCIFNIEQMISLFLLNNIYSYLFMQ